MQFLHRIFPFTADEIKNIPRKPVTVTVVSALCLIGIRFYAGPAHFDKWGHLFGAGFHSAVNNLINTDPDAELWQLVYWATLSFLFYVIVPVLVIKFAFRERLADYGLKLKGMFFGWRAYLLMASFILPVVLLVSFSKEFTYTYPFYRFNSPDKLYPQFVIWELFYILQFFSLEFFFRGFMVLGLKPHLKGYSILAMTLPYCMIHFNKPLPECIGSIFAGLILGAMSYRTGSVWLGALLHVTVALSMDVLSLWHRGLLG